MFNLVGEKLKNVLWFNSIYQRIYFLWFQQRLCPQTVCPTLPHRPRLRGHLEGAGATCPPPASPTPAPPPCTSAPSPPPLATPPPTTEGQAWSAPARGPQGRLHPYQDPPPPPATEAWACPQSPAPWARWWGRPSAACRACSPLTTGKLARRERFPTEGQLLPYPFLPLFRLCGCPEHLELWDPLDPETCYPTAWQRYVVFFHLCFTLSG